MIMEDFIIEDTEDYKPGDEIKKPIEVDEPETETTVRAGEKVDTPMDEAADTNNDNKISKTESKTFNNKMEDFIEKDKTEPEEDDLFNYYNSKTEPTEEEETPTQEDETADEGTDFIITLNGKKVWKSDKQPLSNDELKEFGFEDFIETHDDNVIPQKDDSIGIDDLDDNFFKQYASKIKGEEQAKEKTPEEKKYENYLKGQSTGNLNKRQLAAAGWTEGEDPAEYQEKYNEIKKRAADALKLARDRKKQLKEFEPEKIEAFKKRGVNDKDAEILAYAGVDPKEYRGKAGAKADILLKARQDYFKSENEWRKLVGEEEMKPEEIEDPITGEKKTIPDPTDILGEDVEDGIDDDWKPSEEEKIKFQRAIEKNAKKVGWTTLLSRINQQVKMGNLSKKQAYEVVINTDYQGKDALSKKEDKKPKSSILNSIFKGIDLVDSSTGNAGGSLGSAGSGSANVGTTKLSNTKVNLTGKLN